MKREEFAEVLADIDERHLVEARSERRGGKRGIWLKWGAMAACFALLLGVGILHAERQTVPDADADDRTLDGAYYSIGVEESRDENKPSGMEESGEQDAAERGEAECDASDAFTIDWDETFKEIWGGSYLDENGGWVVWLTENTDNWQREVFARNPSLPEGATTFRTADYSLNYLTGLLARISEGMRAGELPFVSSAAVMEQMNRVQVCLTDESAETMAQVTALDILGGAIVWAENDHAAVVEDIFDAVEGED